MFQLHLINISRTKFRKNLDKYLLQNNYECYKYLKIFYFQKLHLGSEFISQSFKITFSLINSDQDIGNLSFKKNQFDINFS